jgi:hypothetical protein
MAKKTIGTAYKPDEEWRVDEDMRILMQCKEIESDPKRMAKVRALAKKKLEQVASVMAETSEAE